MEPPPSLPVQNGSIPDDTAAAEPPDEPPGVRSRFQGLRVTPWRGELVKLGIPNSGAVVSPTTTAPAARRRATSAQSCAASSSRYSIDAWVSGRPSAWASYLTPSGTPANGPGSAPVAISASNA